RVERPIVGHREHFAVNGQRCDRPAVDALEPMLASELGEYPLDGRRRPVAPLGIALIRHAGEAEREAFGLANRQQNLARRVARPARRGLVLGWTRARTRREQQRERKRDRAANQGPASSVSARAANRTRGSLLSFASNASRLASLAIGVSSRTR